MNKIYFKLFRMKLKTIFIYRKDFFLGLVSSVLEGAVSIIFIDLIFLNFNDISGFAYYPTKYLYFSISFIQALTYLFFMGLIDFSNLYIKNGELDLILLKPTNKIIYIIIENINIKEMPNVIINLTILISTIINMQYSIYISFLLFLSTFLGLIILVSLILLVNSLSFIYKDTLMANKFIISLADISRYPLDIYPNIIKVLVIFIVPLSLGNYMPVLFIDNLLPIFIISLLASIAMVYLASNLFKIAFSLYQSTGS